jgi:hypothetical protein
VFNVSFFISIFFFHTLYLTPEPRVQQKIIDCGPTMSFAVNDPVHVNRENRQLEGVVAFLGSVDFADGDDWVGVRLTGSSVGLGKNDGTVS